MLKKRILLPILIICLAITSNLAWATDVDCANCLGLSTEEINAYPSPEIEKLLPNESLLYDRRYERVLNAMAVHDAPNGNVVRTLDHGFNYVTTQGTQDNWTQINLNEWVLTEHLSQTLPARYAGVLLPEEALPYPIAWILVNVVPSRLPGGEPPEGDLALLRFTLVNIYAAVMVDEWEWYQVGVDQWVEQRSIARILPAERPAEVDTEKWISVDLYEQIVTAYENDRPVFAALVSSGLSAWPTNEGLFHIYARFPRTIMSGAYAQPDFYFLEEVPWTMYFDGDIGLHGTYWHEGFGYRHSHGCVNLSITDANWLYNWSASEIDLTIPSDTGATVYIWSSGQYR